MTERDAQIVRWRKANPDKIRQYNRAYHQAHPAQVQAWRKRYARKQVVAKYGLTLEQYDVLYKKQDGKCALCYEQHETLCVDHCHRTEKVRELLCRQCNARLGWIEKHSGWLDRTKAYLAAHNEQ